MLDVIPFNLSDDSHGNSCKEKKERKQFENYVRNRNSQWLTPKPQIKSCDVVSKGATWAELKGEITLTGDIDMSYISEYGFSYKVNSDDSDYTNVAGNNIENGKFTVKLTDLSPDVKYTYRMYVRLNGFTYIGNPMIYGDNKTFVTDANE